MPMIGPIRDRNVILSALPMISRRNFLETQKFWRGTSEKMDCELGDKIPKKKITKKKTALPTELGRAL